MEGGGNDDGVDESEISEEKQQGKRNYEDGDYRSDLTSSSNKGSAEGPRQKFETIGEYMQAYPKQTGLAIGIPLAINALVAWYFLYHQSMKGQRAATKRQ